MRRARLLAPWLAEAGRMVLLPLELVQAGGEEDRRGGGGGEGVGDRMRRSLRLTGAECVLFRFGGIVSSLRVSMLYTSRTHSFVD